MNRTLFFSVVVILTINVVGAIYLLRLRTPTPPTQTQTQNPQNTTTSVTPQNTQDTSVQSVQQAFSTEVAAHNTDNVRLRQTVVSGVYALQVWGGDTTGGEALLSYDQSSQVWVVLTEGGGMWSLDGLVAQGVPKVTAQILLNDVPH